MSSGTEKRQRVKLLPPVRCTEDELDAVRASADAADKSLSKYIRDELIGRPTPGPRPRRRQPVADRVELARISGLLGKYGSNVNQLARVANENNEPAHAADLRQIAAEVRELKLAILGALGRGD